MSKIRRISRFQHKFLFSTQEEQFSLYFDRFLTSDLGKIYRAIPWDSLVSTFGLQDSKKGSTSIFSPKGKLALMFFKHYSYCSDRRLIEQFNGNLDYQFFCDLHLGTDRLTNFKIISDIRCELSKKLQMNSIQHTLFTHWRDYIKDKDSITMDATCYESYVRYPTDQKLLWECLYWSYRQLKAVCKVLKVRLPRTKYRKWSRRYLEYSKMRRKTAKKRKGLTRSLLLLLDKIDGELDLLQKQYKMVMTRKYYKRRGHD